MKLTRNILLTFGINGSLRKREIQFPVSSQNTEYYLFNSAANLKAYSNNLTDFAYYGYNASNTRSYKLSMLNMHQWTNGQLVSLLFLCSPKEKKQKERAFAAVEKNPVHNARQLAERRYPLRSHRSAPLPCYGRRIFFITPQVAFTVLQTTGNPDDIFYYHTNHLGSTAYVTDQNQNITQGFLYAPFGEITTEFDPNFGNGTLPKYSFNAKELDEETGMYYYEARYYKPPVFTSRDAMFEKYFWMTPYAYCANNPVKYVDPSGKEMSPIYDHDGNFLGTDNQGLQGEAIIMDRSDFKQNMSHDDALAKKKNTFKSFDAYLKYYSHYLNLSSRPDYDGVVTKEEADAWWNAGSGEPLYVDLSKINLPGVTTKSFSRKEQIGKNFLWNDLTGITGTTYGQLSMTLLNPLTGEVLIGDTSKVDGYDFRMNKGETLRNIATFMGRPGGIGTDYNIIGYGIKHIPVK